MILLLQTTLTGFIETMHRQGKLLLKASLLLALLPVQFVKSADLSPANSFADLSIADIECEIEATKNQLAKLPPRLIRESGGTLGFRAHKKQNDPKGLWVEVDLQKNRKFDSIMVIPAVIIDENKVSSNHAFPADFQIRIYTDTTDEVGELLFDSTIEPLSPYPNQSPVIIDCPGTTAQRIRFIPLELHQPFKVSPYIFTLSELLVFNGTQNLALGKPVSAPNWTNHLPTWHKKYLTDGYMPYSEPTLSSRISFDGSRMSVPANRKAPASITLDIGSVQSIDEVRLYPFQADHNFAVFHKAAMGFPKQFKIEISSNAAFNSPAVIFDTRRADYPSPGSRLACFSANGASGRFVKISAHSLPPHPRLNNTDIFAFAEIEIIAQGEPVSYGANVQFSERIDTARFPPSMLVNGISANGKILPLRSWLVGLADRNRMEVKIAALQSELKNRYRQQFRIVKALRWSIGITILLTLIVYFWQRFIRQHQIYRLREDLASDLHDEIGGNFSGIALLSDDLANEKDIPQAYVTQLTNIADISRNSANNTRALVRFLESRNVSGELLGEMRATAELLLARVHYTFDVDGYKFVKKLEPKEKWHLLLFFKEALNNIAKHAEASEVNIQLKLTAQLLFLSITDNGQGLNHTNNRQPAHLTMRAEKLKAKLKITPRPDGGTSIQLKKQL
jgi:signal transduction histidine kinase